MTEESSEVWTRPAIPCLVIAGQGGIQVVWEPSDAEEVEAADKIFRSLRASGWIPHEVLKGDGLQGKVGLVVKQFSPNAGSYWFTRGENLP